MDPNTLATGLIPKAATLLQTTNPLLLVVAAVVLLGMVIALTRSLERYQRIAATVLVYGAVQTPTIDALKRVSVENAAVQQVATITTTILGTRIVSSLLKTVTLLAIIAGIGFLLVSWFEQEEDPVSSMGGA